MRSVPRAAGGVPSSPRGMSVARSPTFPRPALTSRRASATSRRSSRRPTTSSTGDAARACSRPAPGQRRPPRHAGRGARRRAGRPVPASGPDAGRVAVRRHAAQGSRSPSIYVYEQRYRVPGTERERTQRGFFARLRLEAYGPDAGVLPHERTLERPQRGPLQAAPRDRRQHEPGRRAVRRRLRQRRGTAGGGRRRSARRRRHRRRRRLPSDVGLAGRRATARRASSPEHCSRPPARAR